MKIFFIPAHEPIDSELIDGFIHFGHEVVLCKDNPTPWNEKLAKIPDGIVLDSKEKPNIIFCDAHSRNVIFALTNKFRRLWFNVPIAISHLWFPDRRILPVYYIVKHISVCKYGADYLKRISGVNSRLIYLPVDTKFFKPKKLYKKKRATIIGNNFKYRAIMGADYLFKIFDLVHEMDPEIELILNGYNPGLEVPSFVKKTFFEGDYKTGLYNVISKSSCVFFTTTKNFIMHSLENAMSVGRISVCWDLPPFHEIIENGKSGFLIEKFNAKAFAEKIVEVCNKQSRKIGENARKSILEKCEKNSVVKEYIKFFEEISA